ncbi:MAG: hypothetical protein EPO52_15405 [Herbiconiux sp.]|uniref:Zn-ribbon domain-containing OB-fold protein n=1 Tax=Herbiconiux sp. TaxID=1871186 RepID=UPI001223A2E6|nr:OB-fold domain-containing protein [Herbiconiux sp.]TAJ46915.1 MAG: hypothetical protein EPO52_15405 [Herbiconiux sp.]
MMTAEKIRLEPLMDDYSKEWWDAAAERKLLIQRSPSSGEVFFYPRWLTPGTLAERPEWVEASGRGTIYTFSVVNFNANPEFREDCPYVFAIVKLEEGPHMTTRIVDIDPDEVRCDMPVEVDFRSLGGETIFPVFRPARSGAAVEGA